MASRMLNLREAEAAFPGITEKYVYRWVEQGQLHAVKIGKRWHYPEWELRALASSNPNPDGGDAPVKATKGERHQFADREAVAA